MNKIFLFITLTVFLLGCGVDDVKRDKPRWWKISVYSDGKVVKEYTGAYVSRVFGEVQYYRPQSFETGPEINFEDKLGNKYAVTGTVVIEPIKE